MPNPLKPWRRLPMLVRFLLRHAAIGFALAAIFVAAILVLNPQDAGTLLVTGAGHWWPVVVLWFFTGLTFGSVQIGAVTMLLEKADPPRPRHGGGALANLIPVPLRIRATRRR
mgnify:CR=1 FL=1